MKTMVFVGVMCLLSFLFIPSVQPEQNSVSENTPDSAVKTENTFPQTQVKRALKAIDFDEIALFLAVNKKPVKRKDESHAKRPDYPPWMTELCLSFDIKKNTGTRPKTGKR